MIDDECEAVFAVALPGLPQADLDWLGARVAEEQAGYRDGDMTERELLDRLRSPRVSHAELADIAVHLATQLANVSEEADEFEARLTACTCGQGSGVLARAWRWLTA